MVQGGGRKNPRLLGGSQKSRAGTRRHSLWATGLRPQSGKIKKLKPRRSAKDGSQQTRSFLKERARQQGACTGRGRRDTAAWMLLIEPSCSERSLPSANQKAGLRFPRRNLRSAARLPVVVPRSGGHGGDGLGSGRPPLSPPAPGVPAPQPRALAAAAEAPECLPGVMETAEPGLNKRPRGWLAAGGRGGGRRRRGGQRVGGARGSSGRRLEGGGGRPRPQAPPRL